MKKKTPPVDIRKVIRAAAEAALEEPGSAAKPKKRHHLSTGRALVLGAGLMTAGRLLASGRGNAVLGSLQDRLADLGAQLPGQDDEEPEAEDFEEAEAEEDFEEEEPEAEAEEDFEEEEPEAEAEEDLEEESNGGAPERRSRSRRSGRGRA
jgi:hypothetical protein